MNKETKEEDKEIKRGREEKKEKGGKSNEYEKEKDIKKKR